MNAAIIAAIFLAGAIGMATGVGAYTFWYARGASYLANNPDACVNCHVMREHYDGWLKSGHRAAATCNDCHTPSGLLAQTITKVSNGFRHSVAFTTGRFPDPVRIKPTNREITEKACRTCHQSVVLALDGPNPRGRLSCIRCHAAVGHP